MTKKGTSVLVTEHIKSKVDESKVWRGEPTPINREAKEGFVNWLLETDEDERYVNPLVLGRDVCLTFEWFYQLQFNPSAKMPPGNKASMSVEARDWAGLSRFDPCINKVIIPVGIFKGALHTWATMPFFTKNAQGKNIENRQALVHFIQSMPEN